MQKFAVVLFLVMTSFLCAQDRPPRELEVTSDPDVVVSLDKVTGVQEIMTRFKTPLKISSVKMGTMPVSQLYLSSTSEDGIPVVWKLPAALVVAVKEVGVREDSENPKTSIITLKVLKAKGIMAGDMILNAEERKIELYVVEDEEVAVTKGPLVTEEKVPFPNNVLKVKIY